MVSSHNTQQWRIVLMLKVKGIYGICKLSFVIVFEDIMHCQQHINYWKNDSFAFTWTNMNFVGSGQVSLTPLLRWSDANDAAGNSLAGVPSAEGKLVSAATHVVIARLHDNRPSDYGMGSNQLHLSIFKSNIGHTIIIRLDVTCKKYKLTRIHSHSSQFKQHAYLNLQPCALHHRELHDFCQMG